MRETKAWITEDGRIFNNYKDALEHERECSIDICWEDITNWLTEDNYTPDTVDLLKKVVEKYGEELYEILSYKYGE